MLSDKIKKNMFGDATDKEIQDWLSSSEHEFFLIGAKKGLVTGLVFGLMFGVSVGYFLCLIFK